ncbi:MAG: hypothetical protein NTV05_13205 [Acidobacteria bacterium]|nr:hypothetical protein [Acidobacteriota bacterium]
MKIKKQHLHLAVVAVGAAVLWSAWSYTKGPARTPVPAARALDERPLLGPEQAGPVYSGDRGIDPVGIPAPPSVEGAVESASARDPFLFGNEDRDVKAAAPRVGSDPRVRSILFSSGRRLALIENRIVGAGDTVGDFTVVQIDRDAVIFTTATGERRRVAIRSQAPAGIRR